jgi:hypothetical protein
LLLQGLLKVHWDTKEVEVLTNRISASSPLAPDTPLMYANDIDIAADGTIWFTASVNVYPHRSAQWTDGIWHIPSLLGQPGFYDTWKGWGLGLCQGLPKGQLLTYDPRTKETKVVKDGFWYSNGVALSEAEDWIAMSETDRIRVLKIWLKGPKVTCTQQVAGQTPFQSPQRSFSQHQLAAAGCQCFHHAQQPAQCTAADVLHSIIFIITYAVQAAFCGCCQPITTPCLFMLCGRHHVAGLWGQPPGGMRSPTSTPPVLTHVLISSHCAVMLSGGRDGGHHRPPAGRPRRPEPRLRRQPVGAAGGQGAGGV